MVQKASSKSYNLFDFRDSEDVTIRGFRMEGVHTDMVSAAIIGLALPSTSSVKLSEISFSGNVLKGTKAIESQSLTRSLSLTDSTF